MSARWLLILSLVALPLAGCPSRADDDDDATVPDDDDATGDDDDATGDDDDATGDDDDSGAGDDDDATGPVDGDSDGVTSDLDCDDGDPANFPGNVEICDGQDNDCIPGAGFSAVALALETSDTSEPLLDVFAGNIVQMSADSTLTGIELELNAPQGEALEWLVYEGTTLVGNYTLVSQTSTTVAAAQAGSLQWHSSGALSVPLVDGNWYAIGVYGNGTATYQVLSEPASLVPFPAGTMLMRAGGSGGGGTPPAAVIGPNADAWTAQRLWMEAEVDTDGDGFTPCEGDCDEASTAALPFGTEVACDLLDNDCNPATTDCVGGLVISEIFANAIGSDTDQEWFEIYNASGVDIEMSGWLLRDDGGERNLLVQQTTLAAGDYLVLAQDDNPLVNGGLTGVDMTYGGLTMGNSDDELYLVSPLGETVDGVVYDTSVFPGQEGSSMSVDPSSVTASDNDVAANWCVSYSAPYSGDSTGTPGTANPPCAIAPTGFVGGELVITEFLQNPGGNDANREWVEIYNTTGSPVSLQGWQVSDASSDSFVITQPLVVPSLDYVVLGETTDTTANGNAPVDYGYGGSMTLGNDDDEIYLTSPEGTLIDAVEYDGGPSYPDPDGASSNLDAASLTAVANDSGGSWCTSTAGAYGNGGDLGTPGFGNVSCGP
jgi:hypothetical protein